MDTLHRLSNYLTHCLTFYSTHNSSLSSQSNAPELTARLTTIERQYTQTRYYCLGAGQHVVLPENKGKVRFKCLQWFRSYCIPTISMAIAGWPLTRWPSQCHQCHVDLVMTYHCLISALKHLNLLRRYKDNKQSQSFTKCTRKMPAAAV